MLVADRLMIGLIRAGLVAVVGYVIVSVPALIVDRRWIQTLTTAGLTTDAGVDRSMEDLTRELATVRTSIETQSDLRERLSELLELQGEESAPKDEEMQRDRD